MNRIDDKTLFSSGYFTVIWEGRVVLVVTYTILNARKLNLKLKNKLIMIQSEKLWTLVSVWVTGVAFVQASTQSILSPTHLIIGNSKNLASYRYKYE